MAKKQETLIPVSELRSKQADLANRMADLMDGPHGGKRDLTEEENREWETLNAGYDRLGRLISITQRAEAVQADQEAIVCPGIPEGEYDGTGGPGHQDFDGRDQGAHADVTGQAPYETV